MAKNVATNLKELEEAVAKAKASVQSLEAEAEALRKLPRPDAASLRRLDEIRYELPAAKLELLDAKIAHAEAAKALAAQNARELREVERAAFERLKEAERAHIEAQRRYDNASGDIHHFAIQIGELKREKARLLSELETFAAGPLVRSAWQK